MNRPLRTATLLIGAQLTVAVSFGLSGIIGWHGTAQAEPAPSSDDSSVVRSDTSNPNQVWVRMPFCAYEDGNPDARPCLWVDTDTGAGYVNDGHDYSDDNGS